MNLYKLTWGDNRKFVGSQAEVSKTKAELTANGITRKEISVTEVEVPTSKPMLMAWLNENAR